MTGFRRSPACDEARTWAALAPDGELSEFERASLRAHLAGCAACARFAADVERIIALVREDELAPLAQRVSIRSAYSRRRTLAARARPVVAAAAVALMAVGVASRSPLPVDPRNTVTLQGAPVSAEADRREMEALRQQELNIFATDVELAPLPPVSPTRAV